MPNPPYNKPDNPLKQILTPKPHHLDKDFIAACDLLDKLTPQQRLEIAVAQLLVVVQGSGSEVYFSTVKDPPFCIICAFKERARELLVNNQRWLERGDIK